MIEWLLRPISGSSLHALEPWALWHARCMVVGWGVLLPLGALTARYWKVTRRQRWPAELDNKGWWHLHRVLQWLGVGVMTLGVGLAFDQGGRGTPAAALHAWAGWAVASLGWLQVAGGLLRGSKGGPTSDTMRGDHYDMTPHRIWFERLHKSLGWLSLLAAIAVTLLGLSIVDAPRWMPVLLVAWWFALAFSAWRWQSQGRCIDTYQAIWGPGPEHPGNRMRPIGWGIRRPMPDGQSR